MTVHSSNRRAEASRDVARYDCAFIILRLNTGGAERQLVELAKGLAKRGFTIAVLTLARSAFGIDELREAAVTVHECGPAVDSVGAKSVGRAIVGLRELRPRVVIGFMTHGNLVSRLARLSGLDAWIVNGFRAGFEKRVPRLLYRASRRLCDVEVTNSASMAAGLIGQGVVRPRHNRTIENGIDVSRYAPRADVRTKLRSELRLGSSFVWIMVAIMRRDKGIHGGTATKRFDLLIPAFADLVADGLDTKLLLVGDGALRPEIEAQIAIAGLESKVTLFGLRRDVEQILNAADAMVLATDYEGMPNVVLEAFATGLPVVSNAVTGVRDLVDNATGILAEPGSSRALHHAMKAMMTLPEDARQTMVHCALTRASEFSYDRAIDRWQDIISEPRRQPPLAY